ncbi:MAG: SAM-dependent methyltransferase [Methylomonas sp.]|nr:SAM-dependent methyltransferase [Methylomonas sp.]
MAVIEQHCKADIRRSPILHKHEFNWIRDYLYSHVGIVLNDSKQALVCGRLEKRLRHHGFSSYAEYFRLFGKPGFEQETRMAIDLLTTNETYFFREPQHFDFLVKHLLTAMPAGQPLRIWSAASSSGEEAYSLAMTVAEHAKTSLWEIIGTDISSRVLETARAGLYPIAACDKLPVPLLKKYCLKGFGEYDGFFLIGPAIRSRVQFLSANLIDALPNLGVFDVIFLRSVMIYFDMPTKQRLIERIQSYLRPGAYFFVSHSESLNGLNHELSSVAPSIYRKRKDE